MTLVLVKILLVQLKWVRTWKVVGSNPARFAQNCYFMDQDGRKLIFCHYFPHLHAVTLHKRMFWTMFLMFIVVKQQKRLLNFRNDQWSIITGDHVTSIRSHVMLWVKKFNYHWWSFPLPKFWTRIHSCYEYIKYYCSYYIFSLFLEMWQLSLLEKQGNINVLLLCFHWGNNSKPVWTEMTEFFTCCCCASLF